MTGVFDEDFVEAAEGAPLNFDSSSRVLVALGGKLINEPVAGQVAALAVHEADAIRRFYSWPGKKNFEGLHWSSTVERHVPFESLLEETYLKLADFDCDVVGVASQPLMFLWPRGTTGMKSHAPDFLVKLAGGDSRVVDVKPPGRVAGSAQQFALTEAACAVIGWEYQVFTGLEGQRGENVLWLSAYRFPRYAPNEAVRDSAREVFASVTPMNVGIRRVFKATGVDRELVHGNLLYMLHEGSLGVDLDQRLLMEAPLWAR